MPRPPAEITRLPDQESDVRGGALARGLAVLDVVLEAPHALTLAEISKRAKLDLSTTMRLLRSLEDCKYVLRVDSGKRYAGSPRAILPLPVLHPLKQFRTEVFATLSQLSATVKATMVLVAYMDAERFVLDVAQRSGSLAPYYQTWLDGPLHASGSGKALLLTLPPEQRATLLGPEPYPAVTDHTITNATELTRDLESANARGYVVARDEHIVGLTSIAANIPAWQNMNIGCLVMTGHTRDFTEAHTSFVGRQIHQTANLIRHQAPSINALSHYLGKLPDHNPEKRG